MILHYNVSFCVFPALVNAGKKKQNTQYLKEKISSGLYGMEILVVVAVGKIKPNNIE